MVRRISIFALLILIIFSLALVSQFPNTKQSLIKDAYAQACAVPATPVGLTVEYPACNGAQCDLAQADCKWNTQADATSYNLTVTEVETGTSIKNNESEAVSTLKVSFPITQGRTYKCSLVAVSSCGSLSAPATDQLLCQADAMLTPSPTVAPTATPIPTKKPTPTPTIAKPGGVAETFMLIGGIAAAIIGGIILLAL